MKKFALPMLGILLFIIATVVDIFVVSMPMMFYVAALIVGSMLIMSFFADELPRFEIRIRHR